MVPMEAINSYAWYVRSKFLIVGETSISEELPRALM